MLPACRLAAEEYDDVRKIFSRIRWQRTPDRCPYCTVAAEEYDDVRKIFSRIRWQRTPDRCPYCTGRTLC
ncbi:hypothetical protein EAI70_22900 [Escherichia coli]|nr:hypothetical protein EAI70_22900 [Escherichia coli]